MVVCIASISFKSFGIGFEFFGNNNNNRQTSKSVITPVDLPKGLKNKVKNLSELLHFTPSTLLLSIKELNKDG